MGSHTEQTRMVRRREWRSILDRKIEAKCPMCEKVHLVAAGAAPRIMPRIYCPICRQYVEKGYERVIDGQ